ncbi:hypothetical protein AB0M43_02880 [Longispora sp. NPDC051575]|uniref:hypothetical protein n=1 Tax=Longispora sp. NPDC051575 TaxID=3154943 RepID=UPI00342371DF
MTPRTLLSRFRREDATEAGTTTPVVTREPEARDRDVVDHERTVPVVDRTRPERVVPDPVPGRTDTVAVPRGRTSVLAVAALLVGLTALYAALTGVLARPALLIGLLGLILAVAAVFRPTGRRVAGNGLAVTGLLFSVAALAIGIAVATGSLPGLDGGTDQVVRVRDWFAGWWPWMGA